MWTPGDVSNNEVLTPDDHLYASHINELRAATDQKQPADADLTAIAGLTPANNDFLQRKSGGWINRTIAQVRSDLGVVLNTAADIISGAKIFLRGALLDKGNHSFDIAAYGGVNDGVTDNASAIADCRADMIAAGGGEMYFGPGKWYYSTANLGGNYIRIKGAGIDATTLIPSAVATGGNGDGIRIIGTTNNFIKHPEIRDLTIDCSNQYPNGQLDSVPATYSNGVTLQNVHYPKVKNVKVVKPFGYGVQISSSDGHAPFVRFPVVKNLYVEGERGGYDSLGGGGIIGGLVDGLYVYPAEDGTNPNGTAQDWTNHFGCVFKNIHAYTTFVHGISANATPAVPATNTRLVNPFAYPVTVAITGTVSSVVINEITQTPAATYTLPGFGTILLTYSTPPTWTWTPPVAPSVPASGVAANNPFAFPVPVTITGGTVSAVSINGVSQPGTSGYFLVPVGGTITITYSVAPIWSWATVATSEAIAFDYGATDATYEDCSVNGFQNGFLLGNITNNILSKDITLINCKTFNTAFNGIKTNVSSGLGIPGLRLLGNTIDRFGMLGAAAAIDVLGASDFEIKDTNYGAYGNTSYALNLRSDGVNNSRDGSVTNNHFPKNTIYTLLLTAVSKVSVKNNPGVNPDNIYDVGNSGSSKTINRIDGDMQTISVTANTVITVADGKVPDDLLTLKFINTGSYTASLSGNVKKAGGSFGITSGAGSIDIITLRWDGSFWIETGRVTAIA